MTKKEFSATDFTELIQTVKQDILKTSLRVQQNANSELINLGENFFPV